MGNTLWTLLVRGREYKTSSFIISRQDNQMGADNICKQLGYPGGSHYKDPGGSGPILAGSRLCQGGEATVWDCPLQGGKKDNDTWCTHREDMGVACTGAVTDESFLAPLVECPEMPDLGLTSGSCHSWRVPGSICGGSTILHTCPQGQVKQD